MEIDASMKSGLQNFVSGLLLLFVLGNFKGDTSFCIPSVIEFCDSSLLISWQ